MRTKNRKPKPEQAEIFTVGPEPTPEPVQVLDGDKPTEAKPRKRFQVDVPVNPDGTIDFASLRGPTREKLKDFAPQFIAEFGSKPGAPGAAQVFQPAMVAGMYSLLGSIEVLLAQKIGKIPEPIAKKVFPYTPQEIELLTDPTVRVLNKYVPDWMIRYQDEIALATLLVSITVSKVNAAITLAKLSQPNIVEMPKKPESEPVVPN